VRVTSGPGPAWGRQGRPDDRTTMLEEPVYPEDLKYTEEHEWVRPSGESDRTVRVGITHYAQDQLGDIVYVSLPEVGDEVEAGAAVGELESTKSVSDVYVPLPGTVSAVNEALDATPELVNNDPYGEGWLFELTLGEGADLDGLLDAASYRNTLE
jgi:glycine cleavage system H protein